MIFFNSRSPAGTAFFYGLFSVLAEMGTNHKGLGWVASNSLPYLMDVIAEYHSELPQQNAGKEAQHVSTIN